MGDEITSPIRAVIFRTQFWWAVDEGLYEGLPISQMPDRSELPVACRSSAIGWCRDGAYWTLPLDGGALASRDGDNMAAPSIEAWLRFNIAYLGTGFVEPREVPAEVGGTPRNRVYWAQLIDAANVGLPAELAERFGCTGAVYGTFPG